MNQILIDSNILVYAINRASSKNIKAQMFLQENLGKLAVAHQNILESLRILTHPKFKYPMQIADAIDAIENILKFCKIVCPDYHTRALTIELIKKYKLSSDLIFDAYLAATALSNDIKELASDNVRDFMKFREIKVINPFQ